MESKSAIIMFEIVGVHCWVMKDAGSVMAAGGFFSRAYDSTLVADLVMHQTKASLAGGGNHSPQATASPFTSQSLGP